MSKNGFLQELTGAFLNVLKMCVIRHYFLGIAKKTCHFVPWTINFVCLWLSFSSQFIFSSAMSQFFASECCLYTHSYPIHI